MTLRQPPGNPARWHIYVVAFVVLIINGFGEVDYVGAQMFPETYYLNVEPDVRDFFMRTVWYEEFVWAVGVWFAIAAPVALAWRSRWTIPLTWIALAGIVITVIDEYLSDWPEAIDQPSKHLYNAMVIGVQVALLLYARAMRKKGLLT